MGKSNKPNSFDYSYGGNRSFCVSRFSHRFVEDYGLKTLGFKCDEPVFIVSSCQNFFHFSEYSGINSVLRELNNPACFCVYSIG